MYIVKIETINNNTGTFILVPKNNTFFENDQKFLLKKIYIYIIIIIFIYKKKY